MANAVGRPRAHDRDALKPIVLERVSNGELVIDVTDDLGVPNNAPYIWAEEDEEFRKAYARARIQQCHKFAEKLLKIADGSDVLTMFRKRAIEDYAETIPKNIVKQVVNGLQHALINRDKLRLGALQWFTSKLAPKLYGEKLDITSGDEPLKPAQQTLAVEFVAAANSVEAKLG